MLNIANINKWSTWIDNYSNKVLVEVMMLTHWGLLIQICKWIGPQLVQVMSCHLMAPTHHLNQRWLIFNCTIRNKIQCDLNQNMSFLWRNCNWECLQKSFPFCSGINVLTHWGRDKMAAIFPDDIFKCIFLNENTWIPIKISLKFVLKGPINNIPALVQIIAWRLPGDKPLSEPMLVWFTDTWMRHSASMS